MTLTDAAAILGAFTLFLLVLTFAGRGRLTLTFILTAVLLAVLLLANFVVGALR